MVLFTSPLVCEDEVCHTSPQEYCKEEKIKPLFPGDEGYLGDGFLTDKDGKRFWYDRKMPAYPDWTPSHVNAAYSKVKIRIRTEKSSYIPGEKILVPQYIWNASDIALDVQQSESMFFGINDITVTNSSGKEMPLTEKGLENVKISSLDRIYMATEKWCLTLAPNEVLRTLSECPISDFFDMSKPDTYEITFYRWSVMYGQKYDTPLKSNTLKITVSDDVKATLSNPASPLSSVFP